MSARIGARRACFVCACVASHWLALAHSAAATLTNVHPGATIVPPLVGQAASNQLQFLEQLRHWPKKVEWELRTFTLPPRGAESLRFLLFKPKSYSAETNYPLVLSLHGGGPRHQFNDLLEPYTPGFAYGLGRLVSDGTQTNHPCFVVAPWSDRDDWNSGKARLVMGTIQSLQKEFRIDTKRIYVTGQSMGGFGTWRIITEYPQVFAAAVPICGGGEPGDATKAKGIPIWAFHGSADGVVPVQYTRQMIAALQRARVQPQPIYWEYKDGTHADTAERAYCEPEVMEWMFGQTKR